MIWLGKPKGLVAAQLRGDRPKAGAGQKDLICVTTSFCLGQQAWILYINDRAILTASVIALAIPLGGVVAFPKQLE